MIKVTFLGTGTSQGVPPIGCDSPVCLSEDPADKRLRCSILVEWNGFSYVVDSGPDFRYQLIRAGVKKLDGIIFTHAHRDHTAGLDDIRPFNYMQGKAVDIYCEKRVKDTLYKQFDYIFSEHRYPGIPELQMHEISEDPFVLGGLQIIPIRAMHYHLPVLGFRFGNFTYITDANFIAPEELNKVKGSKVLVLNALRNEPHISHFTLAEAVEIAQSLDVPQTYFTHMSHQIGFHQEVNALLPSGMALAHDQLVLEIT